jgi:uncharacterized protein (UPF0335 family)
VTECSSEHQNLDILVKDACGRQKQSADLLGKRCTRIEKTNKEINKKIDNPKDIVSEFKQMFEGFEARITKELLDIRELSEETRLTVTTQCAEANEIGLATAMKLEALTEPLQR